MKLMISLVNYLDKRHYNYCKREIKKLREKPDKDMTDKDRKRIGELYCDIAMYEMEQDKQKKKKSN